MKASEVLDLLQISQSTLNKYAKTGQIKYQELSNKRRNYDRESVISFYKKNCNHERRVYLSHKEKFELFYDLYTIINNESNREKLLNDITRLVNSFYRVNMGEDFKDFSQAEYPETIDYLKTGFYPGNFNNTINHCKYEEYYDQRVSEITPEQKEKIIRLWRPLDLSVKKISDKLNLSEASVRNIIEEFNKKYPPEEKSIFKGDEDDYKENLFDKIICLSRNQWKSIDQIANKLVLSIDCVNKIIDQN